MLSQITQISDRNALANSQDEAFLAHGPDSVMHLGVAHSGRDVWLAKEDILRHVLVEGSTGSGKTEALLTMSASAMAAGSGLVFVDGKGDIATYARIRSLATRMGREDDVLLLNFQSSSTAPGKGPSNTVNPFATMEAPQLVQLLTSLMSPPSRSGDDTMWHDRAVAMIAATTAAVCALRGRGIVPGVIESFRAATSLREIIRMADRSITPALPEDERSELRFYLDSLPGFQWDKGERQSQTTFDQHGYLHMQATRMFASLAKDFRHIFGAALSDIDMADVVLNRRILVVMLPVLEKSPIEVANLGRIVVNLLKNMMAQAMLAPVEGSWSDVVEKRPTNSDFPMLTVFDEFSHYLTPGMAQMAAQARSLGIGMVFAAQVIEHVQEVAREEGIGILSNLSTRLHFRRPRTSRQVDFGMMPSDSRSRRAQPLIAAAEAERFRQQAKLQHAASFPNESEVRSSSLKALDDLAEYVASLSRNSMDFDAARVAPTFEPGECIVVRGESFVLMQATFASAVLERIEFRLNRLLQWAPDTCRIRRDIDRPKRIQSAVAKLLESTNAVPQAPLRIRASPTSGDASDRVRWAFSVLRDGAGSTNEQSFLF